MRLASGEFIITKRTVQAAERLPRIARTAIGHFIAIQGPIELRTHNAIGVGTRLLTLSCIDLEKGFAAAAATACW